MLGIIFKRAFSVLMKKPVRLWAIGLLGSILTSVLATLCGFAIPGLALAVSMLLSTGLTMVYLHGYRGEQVKVVHLFDCFKDWATIKRVLCGSAWATLWTVLWSLIPFAGIVFLIIRTYQYRLVPYILVTEPDVSPAEAIKVSTQRTMGYKGKMFLADFLTGLVVAGTVIVLGLFCSIPYVNYLFFPILFVVSILIPVLLPLFMGLVQAAFYEEITNPTIPAAPVYPTYAPAAPYAPPAAPYSGAPYESAPYAPPAAPPVAPPPPTAAPAFCPNCGTPIKPGNTFCPGCGHRVG